MERFINEICDGFLFCEQPTLFIRIDLHRRSPSGYLKNIKLKTNSYMTFHFRKKDSTTRHSLKTKLFFENVDNSQSSLKKASLSGRSKTLE